MEFRKRSIDEPIVVESKKPRYAWYFKLESESSCASQEDTESVYSYQNRETDIAKDTTDTDTKSEWSNSDLDLEYEIASNAGDDFNFIDDSSGTDDALATAGAIAAAICDSSLEAWATDAEDSDTSSLDETSFGRTTDFWTCVQCKSQNDNPLFRYCEQCYQMRKTLFPPRPRGHKRAKKRTPSPKAATIEAPVKLESLQTYLSGLSSQDSGIGSSQEFPAGSSQEFQALQLDKIVVPKHLTEPSASSSSGSRKRQFSESSLSDFDEGAKKFKPHGKLKSAEKTVTVTDTEKAADIVPESKIAVEKGTVESKDSVETVVARSDVKDLCIICNLVPKNSIFLHGNIGHQCCCYKCAIRTWGLNKRCPACNCKVKNVVKVFTM